MKAAALENDCRRREHFVNVATAALLRTSLRRLFTNRHSHLEAVPAGVTLKVVERPFRHLLGQYSMTATSRILPHTEMGVKG